MTCITMNILLLNKKQIVGNFNKEKLLDNGDRWELEIAKNLDRESKYM